MAGTITQLKFQRHNKERVNVYLDGEYAFGLDALEAGRLHKGQILSDAEIVALKGQDAQNQAFEQAVRFLSYRPRSQAEVERHLREKAVAEDVIASVIMRLEQARYVNDEEFARFWLENRERFKPRGQRALRHELYQKGVSDEIISQVLDEVDDEASAWRAVEVRLSRWAGLPADEFRQKVIGYLRRRGFDHDTISLALEKACQTLDIEDLE